MTGFLSRSRALGSVVRAAHWIRDAFAIVSITVFILLIMELTARAIYRARHGSTDPDMTVDPTPLYAPDYSPHWNGDYIREFRNSGRLQWEPYVYWRRIPYSGQYINVDADSRYRKTYNRVPQSEAKARVFMFGGSTVWGPWIRDDYTIPSNLSRVLERDGHHGVHVSNLAESGHVSTQSLLTLMLQLRRGNIPDIVVFYDGVNDVFSAFQNHEAGIPLNEDHRRREFNVSKQPSRLIDLLLRTSMLAEAAAGLRDRLGSIVSASTSSAGQAAVTDSLVDETVGVYLANVRIAKALSDDYGFEVFFFWQPSLFSKEGGSVAESLLATRYPTRLVEFFDRVYARITTGAPQMDRLYDLQDLFDGDPETVFIDYCHIRETKNERIAEAIGSVIGQEALALPGH